MDQNCYQYINDQPRLIAFLREHPEWYRYLSRDPNQIIEMKKMAKSYHSKTFAQRLEQINNHIEMAAFMLNFADAIKD